MRHLPAFLLLFTSTAYGVETASPLWEAYSFVRKTPQCQTVVGLEMNYSLPIPVRDNKGVRYRHMFYRTYSKKSGGDPDAQVMPPRIFAEYDIDFKDLRCDVAIPMPESEPGKPVGAYSTPATRGMDMAQWEEQAKRFVALEEALSPDFAIGRSGPQTTLNAREFKKLFRKLAEPGLRPYYRALSPEFWMWLEGLEKK